MKERVLKVTHKYNSLSSLKVGTVVLALYSVVLIILSAFHEPWYDEAHAWMIARTLSFKDIVLMMTHLESHPPLWHLVLSVPAKLGFPYEASLRVVNFIFAFLSLFLLEFKSPFTNLTKTILPFSYFFFYQYGLNSRPYMMMFFAIFLCAINLRERDIKPLKMIISLMFLCLTSTYGLVISGGITVAWLYDIYLNNKKGFFKEVFAGNSKRLIGFISLLVLAVFIVYTIVPIDEISPDNGLEVMDYIYLTYMFIFTAPAESMFTSFTGGNALKEMTGGVLGCLITLILSILIWLFIGAYAKKHNMLHFLICSVIGFAAVGVRYLYLHHYGIFIMIFVFIMWVSKENKRNENNSLFDKDDVVSLIVVCSMVVSLFWNVAACINEVKYSYSFGREVAGIIREMPEGTTVMIPWGITYGEDGVTPVSFSTDTVGTNSTVISPYFKETIIQNEVRPYQWLGVIEEEEYAEYFDRVNASFPADVLITRNPDSVDVFMGICGRSEKYVQTKKIEVHQLFKMGHDEQIIYVFERQEN